MLSIAYSGSFILMEETSEKTEKTENSEEALHSIYHSSGFQRTIVKKNDQTQRSLSFPETMYRTFRANSSKHTDYNIDHIYFSSYLRLHT